MVSHCGLDIHTLFLKKMFILRERERERERESEQERVRRREKENPKQAPHSVQSQMWGSVLWP